MALGGLEEEMVQGDEGSWQGEDAGERDCRGGISEECQAWKEAALLAAGEMEVPRFRTGCRAMQVQTEDEVQVVATAVQAEGSHSAICLVIGLIYAAAGPWALTKLHRDV